MQVRRTQGKKPFGSGVIKNISWRQHTRIKIVLQSVNQDFLQVLQEPLVIFQVVLKALVRWHFTFKALKRAQILIWRKFLSLKHGVNLKSYVNKSKYLRFPIRAMCNSILFISKLSSLTVGFLVRNGFCGSWWACHRILITSPRSSLLPLIQGNRLCWMFNAHATFEIQPRTCMKTTWFASYFVNCKLW